MTRQHTEETITSTLPTQVGTECIEAILKRMIGKSCWACVGGYFTGSVVSMNLGEKIPFEHPTARTKATGEFTVFIDGRFWRISRRGFCVVSSEDLLQNS